MTPSPRARFLEDLNRSYSSLHTRRLDALWTALMGLAEDGDAARDDMDRREVEHQRFLQDPRRLRSVRDELDAAERDADTTEQEVVALRGWLATFRAHVIDSREARSLATEIVAKEGEIAKARAAMVLGYRDPRAGFVRASFVRLGVMLESENDEACRRAAWEGLRSIEEHVLANGFLDLVRMRNRLGRMLGAEDFYDWKVRRVEGMTKAEVFALLDELEEGTREGARRGLDQLRAAHGSAAVTPWNVQYLSSGGVTHEHDPYFPLEKAIERWGLSFAALGVGFDDAELVLDLVDREGKFENGFMCGPEVAWVDGVVPRPARVHFTANAIPGLVGSGYRALQTLFHEGGHAAHFANVAMPAPCFGHEMAPTSVAFAETQSMFFDSLIADADWMARYARTKGGGPMPWASIAEGVRARQPMAAFTMRSRLAICYGERAIYEIPDDELTPERVIAELRAVERRLTYLDAGSPRPVLSIPHLLAGDSSAYYHGYLLAKIAVHQTREYFLERDGHLVDNPRIGPTLREAFWRPGNSRGFLSMVTDLTGKPLSSAALARQVTRTSEEAIEEARVGVARLGDIPVFEGPIELGARVRVVHGNESVAELGAAGFGAFAADFERWVTERVAVHQGAA